METSESYRELAAMLATSVGPLALAAQLPPFRSPFATTTVALDFVAVIVRWWRRATASRGSSPAARWRRGSTSSRPSRMDV